MYHSEFHIERIEGLPDEVYLHILKDIHEQRQIRLKDRIKHQNELKLINDEYQNEIHSLIGKENLPTYLRLHKRRMKGMSNLRKAIPKSRDGLIKFENKRHYNIRETKKLLKKAGIDENTLRALQKTHSEKIMNALSNRISLVKRIPKPQPRELESDEWVALEAPFQDYEIDIIDARSTKGPDSYDYNVECDQWSGRMKHESSINVRDAGDSEEVRIETIAEVGSVVRMPSGCSALTVLASFNNIASFARGSLTDECGYSDRFIANNTVAAVRVVRVWPWGGSTDTMYAQIEGVNGGFGQLFIFSEGLFQTNGVIEAWDFDFWESGEHIYADPVHFPGPYNGGDYIAVWVGLWSVNYAVLNDYGVDLELTYQLKVDRIFVNFR